MIGCLRSCGVKYTPLLASEFFLWEICFLDVLESTKDLVTMK